MQSTSTEQTREPASIHHRPERPGCSAARGSRVAIVVMVTLFSVAAGRVPGAETVLENGNFERGTSGWIWSQQQGAQGRFQVVPSDSPAEGNAAQVAVTANGPPHRLQLMHSFPTRLLVPGKAYALEFYAKAQQPTEFLVLLMNRDRPWQNLGVRRTVSVGNRWKRFRFLFRAQQSTQPFAKVNFFLGQVKGTVWIDGVAIEPYDPQAVQPNGPQLEGKRWKLQFFATGAIGRLVQKSSGRVLIVPGEAATAYELTLNENGSKQTVSSEDALSVRAEPIDGPRGYRFVARHDRLRVSLTYQIDPGSDLLHCRIGVENRTRAAITGLRFPIVDTPETLGPESNDDVLLYPAFDGLVVDDPASAFRSFGGALSHTYPGPLSCQVMAFCDRAAGLYLASYDPDGYAKRFTVEHRLGFRFSITHLAPLVPGEDVAPPYPVVLGPVIGDPKRGGTTWYDAAELYRNWSQQQKWAERKVRTRSDTPQWLRQGALVTTYNPRQMTPPGDLSKLESFIEEYSSRFRSPLLPNNRGFERYGMWCGQEYLPVMPDEPTFRAAAELVRAHGGRSMIMLSGYRWTIERVTPEGELYSSQERFDRQVARWAVCDPSGKPWIGTSEKPNDYRGKKWARMCRATELAKKTIVDQARYFVRNGYSVIHFDQECSGGYLDSVCWAENHGHPPGHGRWIHLAMADLYQRLCDACRPLDPDFMLSMEEPNELYLPWLNLCQSRPFGLTSEWPVLPPGTRSVPLFLYLYHENLIGWAAFYPWKSAGRPCYSVAKGFAIGLMPGVVPPQALRGPKAEQRKRFETLLARCMIGYRTFARPYLIWGRMERPLPIPVPQRRFRWRVHGQEGEAVVPAVSHGVWRLDDGRIGVVLINPEPQPHRLKVDLAPLLGNRREVRIRQTSTQGEQRNHSSPQVEVVIEPLDMLLLEISP